MEAPCCWPSGTWEAAGRHCGPDVVRCGVSWKEKRVFRTERGLLTLFATPLAHPHSPPLKNNAPISHPQNIHFFLAGRGPQ